MRMPPGATGVGVRENYELRDGASPSALERCAISAVRSGERDLVVPLRGRADLADLRALRHGYRRPGHDRVRWEVQRAAVLAASLGLRLRSARPG
jgi:hypothetical protein